MAMYDPLHQFEVYPLIPIHIAGLDISFTNASLFMVIVTGLLCVFLLWRKNDLIPSYIQYVQESSFGFINKLVKNAVGDAGIPFGPYIFSLFLFIFGANYVGLTPYSFTVTSHLVVTFALAALVFFGTTFLAIVKHKTRFFRLFFPEGLPKVIAPILVPVEIISYMSRPVSLSIRLFANMVAGHVMIKIFASFALILAHSSFFPSTLLPVMANAGILLFECVIAFLQAYVFTMLTCIYLNDTLNLH